MSRRRVSERTWGSVDMGLRISGPCVQRNGTSRKVQAGVKEGQTSEILDVLGHQHEKPKEMEHDHRQWPAMARVEAPRFRIHTENAVINNSKTQPELFCFSNPGSKIPLSLTATVTDFLKSTRCI
ncbi:hypothetical protein CISG_05286 [Coccidioides immitis RMSCC 3703]|uniref:Uncharacterized protein n=1 Tax=Coccidioides immitis RMSCC 3703 TaxID=454286 RepID=A0A0J8TQK3_COCIT|nr:hypothetical protein CISG_05286 [Coccidioides immitis RMSCC 3703]